MIGILNCWRQFGRRFFWPHLLLGVVAATLGLPQASAHDRAALAETPSRSLNIGCVSAIDHLALLQSSLRRASCNVDYWHQHAIRTVIRHLSFTLTPAVAEPAQPLQAHQQRALLNTLNALLTLEVQPAATIRSVALPDIRATSGYCCRLWLAQVQGIRAGPALLI